MNEFLFIVFFTPLLSLCGQDSSSEKICSLPDIANSAEYLNYKTIQSEYYQKLIYKSWSESDIDKVFEDYEIKLKDPCEIDINLSPETKGFKEFISLHCKMHSATNKQDDEYGYYSFSADDKKLIFDLFLSEVRPNWLDQGYNEWIDSRNRP